MISVVIGKYFLPEQGVNWIVVFVLVGSILSAWYLVAQYTLQSDRLNKALNLEISIADMLEELGFKCERNIETENNGDLDILAKKGNNYFGIEVKNWSGKVEYRNKKLMYRYIFNKTGLIGRLKRTCQLVRDEQYNKDQNIFIRPVFVFGYSASCINIPREVNIDGVNVVFLQKNDVKNFFSTI